MLNWFGSPLIKNAGTLGGNIANGSPIGDTMPALYVLNAEIELTSSAGPRLAREHQRLLHAATKNRFAGQMNF